MGELSECGLVLTRGLRSKGESFLDKGIKWSQQDALIRLNRLDPVAWGEMKTARHLAWDRGADRSACLSQRDFHRAHPAQVAQKCYPVCPWFEIAHQRGR